jgi:hypothetical protein
MRHLTISTALVAGCMIAGAAWAQGSSGSSSSSGSAGGSSPSASPSPGSSSSGTAAQPGSPTLRPPGQGAPENTGVRGTPDTLTGNGTNQGSSAVGNAATGNSGSLPGNETSTGGAATSANRSSTDPDTTGGVGGVNRLQPGERSAVPPTAREEELFRKGEELEQKAREGVCSTC